MNVFPWLMEFWDDIDAMDDQSPHSLDEYARLLDKLPGEAGKKVWA